MGNILTYYYRTTKSTGTQTHIKLTDILTDYNTKHVSSTEMFDTICDICNLEKEAVGYCWNCEQYLCMKCCSHHENISLSQEHRLVGKVDFASVGLKKSLYGKSLIPVTKGRLPRCLRPDCHGDDGRPLCYHTPHLTALFYNESLQTTCFLLQDKGNYELGTITDKGKYLRIYRCCFANDKSIDAQRDVINYFPDGSDIRFLRVTNESYGIYSMFQLGGNCYRVLPFNNGLAAIVSIPTGFSHPQYQIQYLDMKGKVKKQISYDANGQPLFKEPSNLASNATGDILFVSDRLGNCVIGLDVAGNVVYNFTDPSIQCPVGLACDEEGNVYAACDNKIVQIDSHGKQCKIILDSTLKYIMGVCYNAILKQLTVLVLENYSNDKQSYLNAIIFSMT